MIHACLVFEVKRDRCYHPTADLIQQQCDKSINQVLELTPTEIYISSACA